jgi:membrane protein DedA with SNARE-associated domain
VIDSEVVEVTIGAGMSHVSNAQFFAAFTVAAVVAAAVFLYADRNGSEHPTAWAILVFLFLGIALPIYYIHVWRARRSRSRF